MCAAVVRLTVCLLVCRLQFQLANVSFPLSSNNKRPFVPYELFWSQPCSFIHIVTYYVSAPGWAGPGRMAWPQECLNRYKSRAKQKNKYKSFWAEWNSQGPIVPMPSRSATELWIAHVSRTPKNTQPSASNNCIIEIDFRCFAASKTYISRTLDVKVSPIRM